MKSDKRSWPTAGRLTFGILCVVLIAGIAIKQWHQPDRFYPYVVVETDEHISLSYLRNAVADKADCTAAADLAYRTVNVACPSCQIRKACLTELPEGLKSLMSEAPLEIPSARIQEGVISFAAKEPGTALKVCVESERQFSSAGFSGRLKCFPPNISRPSVAEFGEDMPGKGNSPYNWIVAAMMLAAVIFAGRRISALRRRSGSDGNPGLRESPRYDADVTRHRDSDFGISFNVSREDSGIAYRIAKRTTDLVLGLCLLIVSVPVICAAALAIRIETSGSPFFVQTRLGKNGRPFKIVKLRGMFIDARTRFPELYDYSRNKDLNFHFHYKVDPRITRVGKFIRKTSVDELPNFLNVVLGDMSLVGPRPEIPDVLELYGNYRSEYLSVMPGITCESKVTGRDSLTKLETIQLDINYIRNRSFSRDLGILWRTAASVLIRKNVY